MSSPFYLVDHDIQYSLFTEPNTQPNILNQKRANKILHICLLIQFKTLWNKSIYRKGINKTLSFLNFRYMCLNKIQTLNFVFVNSYVVLTIFIALLLKKWRFEVMSLRILVNVEKQEGCVGCAHCLNVFFKILMKFIDSHVMQHYGLPNFMKCIFSVSI